MPPPPTRESGREPQRPGGGLPVGAPLAAPGAPAEEAALPWHAPAAGSKAERLEALAQQVRQCQRCPLHASRTQTVFGVGALDAPILFVGEAPGGDEDRQGEPFVGAAGRLLNQMIAAIGFRREEIYIANVLKCRPPGNRNPQLSEVALCQGVLFHQIEIIAPRALFVMGRFAIESLLGHAGGVGAVRGRVHRWREIPAVATYHPAFYLRQPGRKRAAWEDLLRLRQCLEEGGDTR